MDSHMLNDSLQFSKHSCICIITLKTPKPHISCLSIHNTLLYAASINEINVFDLSNYTHIDKFAANDPSSGFIKSIAFHNNKVFTAHQDCKIRVWQISPCKEHHLLCTLPTVKDRFRHFLLPRNYVNVRRHKKRLWIEHWDTVSGLAVHGMLIYSVSWDKSFKIWNVENNRCLESVLAHQDAVNTVVVSDNGTVYTGSADGLIRVWKKVGKERKHSLVYTLEKHKSTINALALNGDGSVLFSGGCDRSIMVWERKEVDENEHQMVFAEALWGHAGAILCLMTGEHWLVSGSSDRTVRIWQKGKMEGYSCMVVLEGHERPVKSLVAVAGGGAYNNGGSSLSICSGSLDGEIKVWKVSAET
ncbi:protein JINGUBANG-like [Hevea brasiliensis]|nr:protein JINGUBANG-like [Hevea brasiliensis]